MSGLIPYAEALERVTSSVAPISREVELPLAEALGHVLARPMMAAIDSPAFTNSAMDGFAVRAADFEAGRNFRVCDAIHAGELADGNPYQPFTCARIMTGAPLPEWADAVIPVERSTELSPGFVQFSGSVQLHDNVRRQGEDLARGDELLAGGTSLDPERCMILANFGIATVPVVAPLRCVIISTGDELLQPGQPWQAGKVYNSSRVYLEAMAKRFHLKVEGVATLPDDDTVVARYLEPFLKQNEDLLILSTGAVSAGARDFIPTLASALGFETLLHKVAMRPGKPLFFAARAGARWLGLPGNPVSTTIGWTFFVRPLLAAWCRMPPPESRMVRLRNGVKKPLELRTFFRAEIDHEGIATVPQAQGSAHFKASRKANAYVVLMEGSDFVEPDTKVEAVYL